MDIKWVIGGNAQVNANDISYTGTVLDRLQHVKMRGKTTLGHAGIGSTAICLEIQRHSRGLASDLKPAQMYFGENGLIESAPFPAELVLLDDNLPGPEAFVGKFMFEQMRIVAYRTFDSEGGPLQRIAIHASGVNQQGRDGNPMLAEAILIPGFELL